MKHVNMASVDLNLLKTFLAIWELRSLTAAADRLHLSQPAVSHALRRLREIFDDPLFVRTSIEMVPTEAAARLHGPIDHALGVIHDALQQHSNFDPSAATRTFYLSMSDVAEQYVLPVLMEKLTCLAPHVRIEIRQMPIADLGAAMRGGEVDIGFGYLPGLSDECVSSMLMEDEFVCMLREEHPFGGNELTVADLNALQYIYAETDATGHNLAEAALRRAGVRRNVTLKLPHFTAAPHVVLRTDLALIIPRTVAQAMNRNRTFKLMPLPIEMPSIDVGVYTHKRFASDPGIAWISSLLCGLIERDTQLNPG
ncbi:LysR family transcriptional regulator [Paraburkholderia susongensis]|uniref:Transcriptional regulator, LysR family n=1 Tax=Paraburkholderia susongensis TaxID=1515439 RepID=A0A1X7LQT4_9BURK|nr:LysR family transcriptional regulator [Paraburkholderia susongensis]SMG56228.1 transcriptional regulator, LysR family [Paraburkholderia susongensis]